MSPCAKTKGISSLLMDPKSRIGKSSNLRSRNGGNDLNVELVDRISLAVEVSLENF